jgi:hypothetical protein
MFDTEKLERLLQTGVQAHGPRSPTEYLKATGNKVGASLQLARHLD